MYRVYYLDEYLAKIGDTSCATMAIMRVSVVIPAYNEENFIGNCLKALKDQAVQPDEVIVVDNNSSDNTAKIAREMGATVVLEKKAGITPARNAGFNKAKGGIIARCDADTRPFPDWIERIKNSFDDPNVIGVTGTNEFYDAPVEFKTMFEKMFTVLYFQGSKKLIGGETLYGSNMAIRKSGWELVKDDVCLDDAMVHEDIDLSIHLAQHGIIAYDKKLMVGNSFRALRVSLPTMAERMAKWPRSKLVHTKLKRFVRPGRKHSSSAQNK